MPIVKEVIESCKRALLSVMITGSQICLDFKSAVTYFLLFTLDPISGVFGMHLLMSFSSSLGMWVILFRPLCLKANCQILIRLSSCPSWTQLQRWSLRIDVIHLTVWLFQCCTHSVYCVQVRAMQIIDKLEPTRRGPYGGGVGHVSFTGEMDMALALRTMVVPTESCFDYLYDYEQQPRPRREWTVHIQVLFTSLFTSRFTIL